MSKRKYIESHWLVFAAQGLIGLLFGWYVMFTGVTSLTTLVIIVATTLLALAIIDMLNLINRKRRQDAWILTLILALIETVFAVGLLVTINNNPAWPMFILAGYTLFRGLFVNFDWFQIYDRPNRPFHVGCLRYLWLYLGLRDHEFRPFPRNHHIYSLFRHLYDDLWCNCPNLRCSQ